GAYQAYGGFASYAVAPREAVLPIPRGLSLDQSACLLGNYETAYHCLVARGRLAAGETVLVHGASGATGLAAVQMAKVLGATVIATVNDPSIRPPRLAQILRWAESGAIRPRISHTFALADVKEAMRAKWRGDVIGGCVIRP